MRKLIQATFVSLDGVVESPQNWAARYFMEEEYRKSSIARLEECDALLWGRKTYEMFSGINAVSPHDPYFQLLGRLPKHVASKTLKTASWNASVIQGDLFAEVAKLKAQPGKSILKYGSGKLETALTEHGLIDEFHFTIFPVVAGKGERLFAGVDPARLNLKLTESRRFKNGAVTLSYEKS